MPAKSKDSKKQASSKQIEKEKQNMPKKDIDSKNTK